MWKSDWKTLSSVISSTRGADGSRNKVIDAERLLLDFQHILKRLGRFYVRRRMCRVHIVHETMINFNVSGENFLATDINNCRDPLSGFSLFSQYISRAGMRGRD